MVERTAPVAPIAMIVYIKGSGRLSSFRNRLVEEDMTDQMMVLQFSDQYCSELVGSPPADRVMDELGGRMQTSMEEENK